MSDGFIQIAHDHEQARTANYGNGRRKPGPPADPLLSDADYEAIVRDKWDAIERAQVKEESVSFTRETPYVKKAPESLRDIDHIEDVRAMVGVPSIIATHWPVAADEIAAAAMAKSFRQAQEDEALLLVLAELL